MRIHHHPLLPQALGTQRSLQSWHFGPPAARPQIVLQASLHADELPGMLVLHHLRGLLEQAETQGAIRGEIILIPVANPIGLDQHLLHQHLGRFELASAQNFNRHYPDLTAWLSAPEAGLASTLGADPAANTAAIRRAMRAALDRHPPRTELDSLRHTLLGLALDADCALDLHCDFEAAVHLYTEPACLPALTPLAARLGARAVLWAEGSGGPRCYDEALSGPWWQLPAVLPPLGLDPAQTPIPQGCVSATVELRGQTDVSHPQAQADAQALLHFLADFGALHTPAPPAPALRCRPTPLAGSHVLTAPHPGVVAFHCAVGAEVRAGEPVLDLIDPLTPRCTTLCSETDGILYARHILRWATPGLELAKISGPTPRRSGSLLGAR